MHRGFGGTAFEPAEERRDKELTLGPAMLIALTIGLLTLCGFCFVMGYAVGHRGAPAIQSVGAQPPAGPSAAKILGNQPKPSAMAGSAPAAANQASPFASTPGDDAGSDPATNTPPAAAPVPPVRAALSNQPVTASPAVTGTPHVAAALLQGTGWMVQIAAVSHSEDADVLVSALRRRGYAVSARREPADGLLHVQVGPFGDRNEALAMRQRLLGDGYNAIIQP